MRHCFFRASANHPVNKDKSMLLQIHIKTKDATSRRNAESLIASLSSLTQSRPTMDTELLIKLERLITKNARLSSHASVTSVLQDLGTPTVSLAILDGEKILPHCFTAGSDDTSTLFQACSISKPVASVLTFKLLARKAFLGMMFPRMRMGIIALRCLTWLRRWRDSGRRILSLSDSKTGQVMCSTTRVVDLVCCS
mgnify:CR=1 FL=1